MQSRCTPSPAPASKRSSRALPKRDAAMLKATGFKAGEGELRLIPNAVGEIGAAVLGLGKGGDMLALATFSEQLPAGTYRFADVPAQVGGANGALAWALGTYQFTRYKKGKTLGAKLVLPAGVDGEEVSRIAQCVFLARDLINTPPNDMGPEELANAARDLAKQHGAKFSVIVGDALVKQNYPLIHAVGKGSARAPRLADFTWGRANAPKVTLVGKGVVFDTGGYDLKPAAGMATMKKDMGGAATVLAIAGMVMGAKLDVRLRVFVPAVENSVSGSAYRPSDVFTSRKGLTVEIGNTDAEGRLVLADALTEADTETPELLIDIATLTGAARAATGFDLPPFFTDDEALAAELMKHAARHRRSDVAPATVARLRGDAQLRHRRSQQQSELRLCRRDHRGAVSGPLRREGEKLGASRHRRLGRPPQTWPPRRRGSDHGARHLLAAEGAIRPKGANDPRTTRGLTRRRQSEGQGRGRALRTA